MPSFPSTTHDVANQAYDAITHTLYSSPSIKLDPNIVSNAMSKNVYFDYRPVRDTLKRDVGRLGIEIDGARYLIDAPNHDDVEEDEHKKRRGGFQVRGDAEGRSIRKLSIVLAGLLSRYPWVGLEHYEDDDDNDVYQEKDDDRLHQNHKTRNHVSNNNNNNNVTTRPIALYFNTVRQALLASQELQLLKLKQEKYKLRRHRSSHHDASTSSLRREERDLYVQPVYDNIRIFVLDPNNLEVPIDMTLTTTSEEDEEDEDTSSSSQTKRRKPWGHSRNLRKGKIDPKQGLLLIVRPTDYNIEFKPPGPSFGTIDALQMLLARASVHYLPCVVISPRLTEQLGGGTIGITTTNDGGSGSGTSSGNGWDQSGYQKSATYGGAEPPNGPTPWIIRDLYPPVYTWVGCALNLVNRRPSLSSLRGGSTNHNGDKEKEEEESRDDDEVEYYWYHPRIVMYQSVMEEGH
eukprot:12319172-Ditylum_brightwellii.AAC.1